MLYCLLSNRSLFEEQALRIFFRPIQSIVVYSVSRRLIGETDVREMMDCSVGYTLEMLGVFL